MTHEQSPQAEDQPLDRQDDLALVKAIQNGDRDATSELLQRHQDRLYGVCLRMVNDREWAADLTQDAMVKIIQGIDSFDGRASPSTWMIRITMNVCLSWHRSQKLRRHISLGGGGGIGEGSGGKKRGGWEAGLQIGEPGPSSGVQDKERRRLVVVGLGQVSDDQRAILVLRDVRSMEYEQIADVLGIAVGTVKSRLFRARAALRSAVEALMKENGSTAEAEPGQTDGSTQSG